MLVMKMNSLKAWILASRPKTLAGAVTPVMIGCALAAMDGKFVWQPALICLLFAALMQVAANFINDLFDFLKGTDGVNRLGPKRACSQAWISPSAMKKGIIVTLLIACAIGSLLLLYAGWELIPIGMMCVLFAFLYTSGPYPLSYHGWGDVLVLVFFGFVPVGITYYIQAGNWTMNATIAALVCGLIVDTLLVVNNYRDRDTDAQSGKRTIIVRFGEPFGRYLYLSLGLLAAWLCLLFALDGHLWAALLPQFYLIPHFRTWQRMVKIHKGKELNSILGETSRNMLLMGILLSIGLLLK
ncbi:MAG: 1,4-dihydroxy-2-naphthoate polyprenyltransferase [Bacteroidaceae bacterium]